MGVNIVPDLSGVQSMQWRILFKVLCVPEISELEINGPDEIFVTRRGKRLPLSAIVRNGHVHWTDKEEFHRYDKDLEDHMEFYGTGIRDSYCLFEGGLRLNATNETTGEEVKIRARCHIVLPPVAEDFPIITIAKQSTSLTTLESILQSGSMNRLMMEFVKALVHHRKTVVISGGSGAGKTTFLSAMTREINPQERVIVCEDAPELQLPLNNVVYMRSYPARPGMDANKQADLSWVVRQVQRQRPDRVIVGESRGPEFSDFITAANSGYDGSLTTIHANDPNAALEKMAGFCKRAPGAGSTPMESINKDIKQAVDYIIQLKYQDGKYRMTGLHELDVVSTNGTVIKTNTIFSWDKDTDTFQFRNTPMNEEMHRAMDDIRNHIGVSRY